MAAARSSAPVPLFPTMQVLTDEQGNRYYATPDGLVPIPLTPEQERQRRYEQAVRDINSRTTATMSGALDLRDATRYMRQRQHSVPLFGSILRLIDNIRDGMVVGRNLRMALEQGLGGQQRLLAHEIEYQSQVSAHDWRVHEAETDAECVRIRGYAEADVAGRHQSFQHDHELRLELMRDLRHFNALYARLQLLVGGAKADAMLQGLKGLALSGFDILEDLEARKFSSKDQEGLRPFIKNVFGAMSADLADAIDQIGQGDEPSHWQAGYDDERDREKEEAKARTRQLARL